MIPKFERGQPITAAQLNQLVDAANRLSGGCRPPSQIRARVPSSQAVIFSDDWRVVSQATPTTTPTKNVATGSRAYSNASNSYDSTTNGKRLVIHFETPIKSYGTIRPVFYLGLTDPGYGTCYAKYSGGSNNSTGKIEIQMRIRPITADWDNSTVTWNNLSSLTIGSAISYPKLANLDAITAWGTAQQCNLGSNVSISCTPVTTSPGDIFGLVIDCQPTTDVTGYTAAEGQLSFTCNSASFPAPFAIVPQQA